MNKKDLAILLLIPVIVFSYTIYGIQQFKIIQSNTISNSDAVNEINGLITKIKSDSPEKTQVNLVHYMNKTKKLLHAEQVSEQLYISFIRATFRDALICTSTWILLLLLVFYETTKRTAKQNL